MTKKVVGAVHTTWYIHPKDAHTNEVLSEALKGLQNQEKFSTRLCVDGIKRELVEVPDYAFVARFERSKKTLNLMFTTYRAREGQLPDQWRFPTRKKLTLATLLKDKKITNADQLPTKRATQF